MLNVPNFIMRPARYGSPSPMRVVRATIGFAPATIEPKTSYYIVARPQVAFRLSQLWIFSPGPDLLIEELKVGNISLLHAYEPIPAELWDIDAITRAVDAAVRAGWTSPDGSAHPLYERLKIPSETCSVGMNIAVQVRNPTDSPLAFRAAVQGIALDGGGGFSHSDDFTTHPPFEEPRFDDVARAAPPRPAPETPVTPTEPPPATERDPLGAPCRACGATAGTPCHAVPKGKSHPVRGLRPGECPGCPRAAWALGMRAACNLCGKTSP